MKLFKTRIIKLVAIAVVCAPMMVNAKTIEKENQTEDTTWSSYANPTNWTKRTQGTVGTVLALSGLGTAGYYNPAVVRSVANSLRTTFGYDAVPLTLLGHCGLFGTKFLRSVGLRRQAGIMALAKYVWAPAMRGGYNKLSVQFLRAYKRFQPRVLANVTGPYALSMAGMTTGGTAYGLYNKAGKKSGFLKLGSLKLSSTKNSDQIQNKEDLGKKTPILKFVGPSFSATFNPDQNSVPSKIKNINPVETIATPKVSKPAPKMINPDCNKADGSCPIRRKGSKKSSCSTGRCGMRTSYSSSRGQKSRSGGRLPNSGNTGYRCNYGFRRR